MKSGLTKSQASALSMRAQLFTMKVEECQHEAEMKTRAAALEKKHQLEKKIKMMESKRQDLKWKEDQYKLETETCCAVSPVFLLAPAPCCPLGPILPMPYLVDMWP